MPRSVATIQIGQCGNQVGAAFWSHLITEHGLNADGQPVRDCPGDRKDVFFAENSDGHFTARALLVDTEPHVLNEVLGAVHGHANRGLFAPNLSLMASDGAGAANRWSNGYSTATRDLADDIDQRVSRLLEPVDSLGGLQVLHSVAGGTGSGVGSWMLEFLRDKYPKQTIFAHTVFPNTGATDVVVQPYNVVLSIPYIHNYSDCCVCYDNAALGRVADMRAPSAAATWGAAARSVSYSGHNDVIASVIAACTASLRFPGTASLGSLASVAAAIRPSPQHVFAYAAATSAAAAAEAADVGRELSTQRSATARETIQRLLRPRARLADLGPRARIASGLALVRGPACAEDVATGLRAMIAEDRGLPAYAVRAEVVPSPVSAGVGLEGTLLAVSPAISRLMDPALNNFNIMYSKGAHLHLYNDDLSMISSSAAAVFPAANAAVSEISASYKSL